MIATEACDLPPYPPAGCAVFHVSRTGPMQHAGIAIDPPRFGVPIRVFAMNGASNIRETWGGENLELSVIGYCPSVSDVRYAHVLRACNEIEGLIRGAVGRGGQAPCCLELHPIRRVHEDALTGMRVWTGSCAGFVEECYARAEIDLVDCDKLPLSEYDADERPLVKSFYKKAGGAFRRLYPSYQIRAFQLCELPWVAELKYHRYPRNFL